MLDDRDYMRPGDYRRRRARRPMTAVNILLIVNIVIWVVEIMTSRGPDNAHPMVVLFGMHWETLQRGFIWQPLTYMFMHDPNGILHIGFNMFALWMFGRPVEQIVGRTRFLKLYFISGLAAAALWMLCGAIFPSTVYLREIPTPLVGASGAILGMIGACAVLVPNSTVLVFFFLPMKMRTFAIVFAIFSIIMQVTGVGRSVAHLAHVGGLAAGWLYLRYALKRGRNGDLLSRVVGWARAQRRARAEAKGRGPADLGLRFVGDDDDDDIGDALSQVDPILDKISRQGMKSLTKRELRILDRAKEQLRDEGR